MLFRSFHFGNQAGLIPEVKAERVKNYVNNTVHDLKELLAASGNKCLSDLSIDQLYIPGDSSLTPFLTSSPLTSIQ